MEWEEERLGSKQWCYPHTGDALDLHCLAKLSVARKYNKKYPHFEDLKKPLTEMEKEELEIVKEAARKKEKYHVGCYSPHVSYKVFDDAGEQEDLIKQARGEPLGERLTASKETRRRAWHEAIHNGDFSLGEKIGLFLPDK